MKYYKQKSNIIFSGSVQEKDEQDFKAMCVDLKRNGIPKGRYFINNYKEHHQGQTDEQWKLLAKEIGI